MGLTKEQRTEAAVNLLHFRSNLDRKRDLIRQLNLGIAKMKAVLRRPDKYGKLFDLDECKSKLEIMLYIKDFLNKIYNND